MWQHVKDERFEQYQKTGQSASMMDHYYDKLLHIAHFSESVVQNRWLTEEAARRVKPLVDVCVAFGQSGEVPVDLIKSFM